MYRDIIRHITPVIYTLSGGSNRSNCVNGKQIVQLNEMPVLITKL